MGWNFRKSFKILPGIRLNFGKDGYTSTSVGGKWFRTNFSRRGVRQTASLPGSGISYSSVAPNDPNFVRSSSNTTAAIIGGLALALVLGVCGTCGLGAILGPATNQSTQTKQTPSRNLVSTPQPTAMPEPTPTPKNKKGRKKMEATTAPSGSFPLVSTPSAPAAAPRQPRSNGFIRGPRGGCYYINSRGNKTYVDRGMCD